MAAVTEGHYSLTAAARASDGGLRLRASGGIEKNDWNSGTMVCETCESPKPIRTSVRDSLKGCDWFLGLV